MQIATLAISDMKKAQDIMSWAGGENFLAGRQRWASSISNRVSLAKTTSWPRAMKRVVDDFTPPRNKRTRIQAARIGRYGADHAGDQIQAVGAMASWISVAHGVVRNGGQ